MSAPSTQGSPTDDVLAPAVPSVNVLSALSGAPAHMLKEGSALRAAAQRRWDSVHAALRGVPYETDVASNDPKSLPVRRAE